MINDQYSPEEQVIIQQIQAIPRLEISAAAREAIRARMLSEFRGINEQSGTNSVPQTRLVALTVTALIVVTVIVIIILAIISSQNTVPLIATATANTPLATHNVTTTSTPIPTETMTIIASPTEIPRTASNVLNTDTPESPTLSSTTDSISLSETVTGQTAVETAGGVLLPPTIDSALAIAPAATTFSTASLGISATLTLDTEQTLIPSVTPTPPVLVVIEGPVLNIVNNIITIYDFEIEVEVDHPILNLIEPGDLVHIEGAYGNSEMVVASVVSNLSSAPLVTGATVSLDGPVESINGNIIVVNGIAVQLAANDPLLQTIQVDQFVSVQGNFQGSGTNIVLVVVTIVINTNVTVTENNCWYHDGMGMGHWHCDGQGMGMGMGDAGMGMGDPGMGMGMGDG